jgi:putative oxidoreductase
MMESAPFNYRRIVILLGRLILGGIFVYAGGAKIFYPNQMFRSFALLKFSVLANLSNFGNQVNSYKILSPQGVDFVAHTLPWAEIVLGLLLLIGWRIRVWASVVSLLLLAFFSMVTRAYILHMQIDCGCFGKPEPVTGFTLLRDGSFLVLALLVTMFAFQQGRQPHPWSAPAEAERA